MLFAVILMLALATGAADILHFQRRIRRWPRRRRTAFAVWAAVTDALPLIVAFVGLASRDNDTPFMTFALWSMFGWMVTALPRMVFYVFSLLRLRRAGYVAAACLALFFAWGATTGRTRLLVNRVEIRSARIPAGFDGFRIAQISDIHLGTIVRPERELVRIVDSIEALRPDLVVFTGDLVNIRYTELDGRVRQLLGRLKAPCGVVSVTGNHDVGVYIKDSVALPAAVSLAEVIARQRAMGWRVLEDTTLYLRRGGDSISLSGISFDPSLREKRHDRHLPAADLARVYRDVPDTLFNITAVHIPQLWPQITAAGYGDLTLAGHVHSMQMKFRVGRGRGWSPARLLYDRWSGRYDDAGRTLYINDGTGCVGFPMRLGAWPEITLFTLKRCE